MPILLNTALRFVSYSSVNFGKPTITFCSCNAALRLFHSLLDIELIKFMTAVEAKSTFIVAVFSFGNNTVMA